MRGFFLGVFLLFLAATPASAVMDLSGNRLVAAFTHAMTGEQKDTAALGFWSETAASAYSDIIYDEMGNIAGGGSTSASASQTSNLGDLEISMLGTLAASSTPGVSAAALSILNASFMLDSEVAYVSTLVHTAETMQFTFASSAVSYDANSSGVLPAGFYSLHVLFQVSASPFGEADSGAYAYKLTLAPEPSAACLILVGILLAAAPRRRNCPC